MFRMSVRIQRINPLVLICLVILFLVYINTMFNPQVQLIQKIFLTTFAAVIFVLIMLYETVRISDEEKHH